MFNTGGFMFDPEKPKVMLRRNLNNLGCCIL